MPLPHPTTGRRRATAPVAVALAFTLACGLALAACSSGSTAAQGGGPATTAATTGCVTPSFARHVQATPVPGSSTDWSVTSFDGTVLRAHWFPVHPGSSTPSPTVLMGPGWSLAGDTDTNGIEILGDISISTLWKAGYNVLTWDPRGFGQSAGAAEVDSPSYEAKDVSMLISWVATRPGVELDAPGNPRMGMVGGSYGGGIQLVTAATDCRVDAIVPTIAWHSLATSLYKADIVKIGWANLLTNLSSSDHVAPQVTESAAQGNENGTIDPGLRAWFTARGPGRLVGRIRVPTLLVQGTVDTLFTLQEAVDNLAILRAHGVTASMLWYCGGHGVCLTPGGNQELPVTATVNWLDRYVQRDTSVDTGPGFRFVDQNGHEYSAPSYPVPTGRAVTGDGSGTLPLVAAGGSGPVSATPQGQELASLVGPITPAPATNAVDVDIPFPTRSAVVVGAPRLELTYHGTVPAGTRPTRVFAQLVDQTTGLVVGNQITPIQVTLDGKDHTTTVPLEMVAFTGTTHSHLELQVVATTTAYAQPRLGGSVDFSHLHVSLPVAAAIVPR